MLSLGNHRLPLTRVGPKSRAAFSVIFIHGRGGDRGLGVNDYTFGGNFNRLKNLIVQNGGSYYSPTIRDFGEDGIDAVARLIAEVSERGSRPPGHPRLRINGQLHLLGRRQGCARGLASGGARNSRRCTQSGFRPAPSPIAAAFLSISHTAATTRSIPPPGRSPSSARCTPRAIRPRMTLFATGSHGTPIRMTDWWRLLNWTLAQGR